MFADVRVHSREWVVEIVDVGTGVHSSGQGNPLFLSAAQIDSFLADFRFISSWQNGEIGSESTHVQNLLITRSIVFSTEEDVVLDRRSLDPSLLRYVRNRTLKLNSEPDQFAVFLRSESVGAKTMPRFNSKCAGSESHSPTL